VKLRRMRCSGDDRRDIKTATVEAASDATTKKCQGLKPASDPLWSG
jgi:hypothetical protein